MLLPREVELSGAEVLRRLQLRRPDRFNDYRCTLSIYPECLIYLGNSLYVQVEVLHERYEPEIMKCS